MSVDFIPTKAALLKANATTDFKVVKYESYKSKPKTESTKLVSVGSVDKEDKRKGIDIQRARREIIKFGISGFTHQRQQEAKVALAVSLGAKEPKKEHKNYKQLIEERKRQKRLDKKYEAMNLGKSSHSVGVTKQKMVFNKTLKLAGDHKKKRKDDPLQIYGKATLDTRSKNTNIKKFNKKKR